MNIKIRELAWAAGISAKNVQGDVETNWAAIEKFAQFIIDECAERCAEIDGGENEFSRGVRQQFEVE